MSRPESIIIPGIAAFERRQQRAYAAFGYNVSKEHDNEPERRAVLAGLATKFDEPFVHDGQIQMLAPGVFASSLKSGQRIALQLDHDDGTAAASTANGLELEESDVGLLFRLDMRRTRNASAIHSIVDGGNRACVSVAYQVERDKSETYGAHKVRVITQASLKEISLVRRGVVGAAFAFITDDVCNPSINALDKSTMFALCRAHHNVRRATDTIRDNTAQLTARVDRLWKLAGHRV
jgi:HK97 family phage prohead protease